MLFILFYNKAGSILCVFLLPQIKATIIVIHLYEAKYKYVPKSEVQMGTEY